MTAAEVRAIRAGLGVTAEWLADHIGVRIRAVQRWESGASFVKANVAEVIVSLEAEAADQVAEHVEALSRHPSPVLVIEDLPGGLWPPGWQRMVAFRVRQQIAGLQIVELQPHSELPEDGQDAGSPTGDDYAGTSR